MEKGHGVIPITPTERFRPAILLGPLGIHYLLFFILPLIYLLASSFLKFEGGITSKELTLFNYQRFLFDPFYLRVLVNTLGMSLVVSSLTVILGYPVAYFLVRTRSRWRSTLIAMVYSPLLTSVVARTYGWLIILDDTGVVNQILLGLGIVDKPVRLVFNFIGVTIGLTHVFLPYNIFCIMTALQNMSPTLEYASMNLGAGKLRTFFKVTLPLSMTGVVTGFLLVFSMAISAWATPAILGGQNVEVMATLVYSYFLGSVNWPFASAIATISMAVSLTIVFLSGMVTGKSSAGRF